MVELNRVAAEAATELGVSAATDVTGFGLLGHAWEMAQASRVDIVIDASSVPLLPGAFDLARQSLFPQGSVRNYDFVKVRASFADRCREEMRLLLCDAQTSGGLLLAVDCDLARRLLTRLHRSGVKAAAVIGSVKPGAGAVRVG
jgi:selenide,water dikinase